MLQVAFPRSNDVIVLPADGAPAAADIRSSPKRTSAMSIDELLHREPAPHQGIGVIAPFDFALDRELWRWTPDHVSVHVTRTPYVDGTVSIDLAKHVSDPTVLARAARDLSVVEPLAVGYACTSGSFVEGVEGERRVRSAMAGAGLDIGVTASGALLSAAFELGITNFAVVAPYVPSITDLLVSFMEEGGLECSNVSTMDLDSGIWRISYGDVVQMVLDTDMPSAEAVFVSCTNVPTYDIIAPLERELGKPVLSANQVLMWAALRAANLPVQDGVDSQMLIDETMTDVIDLRPSAVVSGSLGKA